MNSMNMPGFTAVATLYRSTGGYAAKISHAAATVGALIPALSVTYCQNLRPGWAIENRLCGDCADFELQCVGAPGARTCQWVQVSDWRPECWDVEAAQ